MSIDTVHTKYHLFWYNTSSVESIILSAVPVPYLLTLLVSNGV